MHTKKSGNTVFNLKLHTFRLKLLNDFVDVFCFWRVKESVIHVNQAAHLVRDEQAWINVLVGVKTNFVEFALQKLKEITG